MEKSKKFFIVAKYIDKYNIMFENVTKTPKNEKEIIMEFIDSWLPKSKIEPMPDPVKYDMWLFYIQLLPADAQYEIMKNAPNFTSLVTLKKYCHKEAFNNIVVNNGISSNGVNIVDNGINNNGVNNVNNKTWLSNLWDSVHAVATYGERHEMLNAYAADMTMFNVWRKRIGYISVGIATISIVLSCVSGLVGFYKIYQWMEIVFPILKDYIYFAMQELHKINPTVSMLVTIACWPYYNYGKMLVFDVLLSCTRFNQCLFAKIITFYTTCLIKLMWLPYNTAKKGAWMIFDGFTWVSSRVGNYGFKLLNYCYADALIDGKEHFIHEVMDY